MITRGTVGITATSVSLAISLTDLEQYLRVASLVAGLMIGVLTIISILRKWNKGD